MKSVRVGILGAAGYTGGELIRLLVHHPLADIAWAHSESSAGRRLDEVHEGLVGDTDLTFSGELDFDAVDVLFFCFGHGKSEAFLREHTIPERVKIIDLAQDFRLLWTYGLPEAHREAIKTARRVANPGCFATCIQLGLLPLAKAGLLKSDVVVNAITGSTGAGQKPGPTTHFSWRANNISAYKVLTHQHLAEVVHTLRPEGSIDFVPLRGDLARGIFATMVLSLPEDIDVEDLFRTFYAPEPFTHYLARPIDLKQVVGTNKALVHAERVGRKVVITAAIDNLLKGAVGQAVENMNLMCGFEETTGLRLKAVAF